MRKIFQFLKIKLKKPNVRVGVFFIGLSILMIRFYFELGLINRIILAYNIIMFLLISGYLLINKSLISKTGKSLMHPFKVIICFLSKGRLIKSRVKVKEEDTSKRRMYYSRTYRHLRPNYLRMGLFFLFFMIPALVLFILSYSDLSRAIVFFTRDLASSYIESDMMSISSAPFLPFVGDIYYIAVEGPLPSINLSLWHLFVTLLTMIVVRVTLKNHIHIRIYLLVTLTIHLSSAVFMYFGADAFPYSLTDYSELYMKQQIGIWLSIFSIVALLSGVINYSGFSKFVFVLSATIYSFIFGVIRYSAFLGVMHNFSIIYMTSFFFSFGPFVDFLYLVWMYSLFMRFITARFSNEKGVVEWHWA